MQQADAILAVLAGHPAIELAIVFGSLAKGTARSDRDLDLAVHNYDPIDWKIVFNICQHHLGDFGEFSGLIYRGLEA